jgi:hypothetical protein
VEFALDFANACERLLGNRAVATGPHRAFHVNSLRTEGE